MTTIRTVTLSPGFDHVVAVDGLVPGGVGRVVSWRKEPAGKGINAARATRYLGGRAVAYSLVGAPDQETFNAALATDGIDHVTIAVPQSTRNNLTLINEAGGSIASHAVGPRFSEIASEPLTQLFVRLVEDAMPGDIVSFNGSLPTGTEPALWSIWAKDLASRGVRLVADVQGEALREVIRSGSMVTVKPNEVEMGDVPGVPRDGDLIPRAVKALSVLKASGVDDPVVTLGALGVVHYMDGQAVLSSCPVGRVRIVVGSGDVFLAGYCTALADARTDISPVWFGLAAASAHVEGFVRGDLASATQTAIERISTRRV